MKKSEIMKKQAERAFVVESIIDRIKRDMNYDIYDQMKDEDGNYVTNEDGEILYELPESKRDEISWGYNYLTKADREEVYLSVISTIEKMLEKM